MIDNSDIPLPADELRSNVLVFAITDLNTHEYQEITKGYVELSTDEDQKNIKYHYLEVKDEKTHQVLMRSNLKLENNFGKQKGSIISWTDQQQPQYTEIALSFEKDQQCDTFWRNICQKIGKCYLQISGSDRLQTPTVDNLNYNLQKAKNNIDLVDYNVVHSKKFIEGLQQVFHIMKADHNQMGMGMIARIVNTIMSPSYSINAIQTLLTGQNFFFLLDLQEFKKGINFKQVYNEKVNSFTSNKFNLPKQILQKIELSHRAIFYRQNVLDLADEVQLQSIMFMISKQALVQIMSYLNRSKCLETMLKNNENNSNNMNEQSLKDESLTQFPNAINNDNDKIQFIHETLINYQHMTSQQIKGTFKQSIYTSGVLEYIHKKIEQNNLKAIQVLYYIVELDKIKFFEFLIQDFKVNSSQNLLKTLMKKYINKSQFRNTILVLIGSFCPIFNQKKQLFDFFNGTFVCSVFSIAKDSCCSLLLSNILLSYFENSSNFFTQLIRSKIFQKLTQDYRSGIMLKSKFDQLEMIKLLKHIIIQQSHKGSLKNKEIQNIIIQSGFFDCCLMIYFKHSQKYNIISSSMLENLKLIQKMDYSKFDQYLIKQHSENQNLTKILEPIKKKHLQFINTKKIKNISDQYVELQRIVHKEILENQEQDSYLMNEENQNSNNHIKPQPLSEDKQKALSIQTNDEVSKENNLQYLKRMMDQFTQEREEEQQKIQIDPRKLVKKTEEIPQMEFQLTFDLPDMQETNDARQQDT